MQEVIAAMATEPCPDLIGPSVDLEVDRAIGTHVDRRGGGIDRLGRRRDIVDRVARREGGRIRGRERRGRRVLDDAIAGDGLLAAQVGKVPLQPVREVRLEVLAQGLERHPVLGTARPGHGWLDARQVELEQLVEDRAVAGQAPQALRLGIALDQLEPLGRASGQAQVGEGLVVDREERRRRPELGAHVADRRPVGEGQRGQPVPGELDERPDHPMRAKHLCHDQDQVGRGRAAWQRAVEADPDDVRHRLVERLAEQDRLGLDAADAIAQDAEAVDHGRV